jgi:hypothetical protein
MKASLEFELRTLWVLAIGRRRQRLRFAAVARTSPHGSVVERDGGVLMGTITKLIGGAGLSLVLVSAASAQTID